MSNFEFISYQPTPLDKYMIGIATVRCYGKVILRFKGIKTKDGTSVFYSAPSYGIDVDGEKKYIQGFLLDSRAEEELLNEVVRVGVRDAQRLTTANLQAPQQSPSFISQQTPTYSDNPLPF